MGRLWDAGVRARVETMKCKPSLIDERRSAEAER